MIEFLKEAAKAVPSARQLAWFDMGVYAFIHFGVNTYTDREWGTGTEPESVFNPVKLDCRQWARTLKEAGIKGMILTAKHHDGFCLWPSKYTEHSVKNSPCKRDVVGEAAAACREEGLRFGFYLSPWDRNSVYYGTPEYNDYYCNQLMELLTEYGEIFCVWLDGACGEGPDGKKQEYDYGRYISLIRKHQPGAVIFSDRGPDIRWCGNEEGSSRVAEWATVPAELCPLAEVQTGPGPRADEGDLGYLYNTDKFVGGLSNILYSKGLAFVPAEIDTSIRKGWFWHQEEEPRPLEKLFEIYLGSVGGNTCLNLNIPPDRDGLFDERDVKRLRELRALLDRELGHPLEAKVEKKEGGYPTQPEYVVTFAQPVSKVRYVELEEDIARGQRVEEFHIKTSFPGGNQYLVYQGTTIGNRRICALVNPFAEQDALLDDSGEKVGRIIVKVTAARDEVFIKNIRIF